MTFKEPDENSPPQRFYSFPINHNAPEIANLTMAIFTCCTVTAGVTNKQIVSALRFVADSIEEEERRLT